MEDRAKRLVRTAAVGIIAAGTWIGLRAIGDLRSPEIAFGDFYWWWAVLGLVFFGYCITAGIRLLVKPLEREDKSR